MLSSIRYSPALPNPPASPRRSNHFVSAASALFQEGRFYAPFVFNTLRTLCIVESPSTPTFPAACALFGEKHGSRGYRSLSPLFSGSSALFPTGTLSFRGEPRNLLLSLLALQQERSASSTSVHNAAQTVHSAAQTCNTRAFRCKNVHPRATSAKPGSLGRGRAGRCPDGPGRRFYVSCGRGDS